MQQDPLQRLMRPSQLQKFASAANPGILPPTSCALWHPYASVDHCDAQRTRTRAIGQRLTAAAAHSDFNSRLRAGPWRTHAQQATMVLLMTFGLAIAAATDAGPTGVTMTWAMATETEQPTGFDSSSGHPAISLPATVPRGSQAVFLPQLHVSASASRLKVHHEERVDQVRSHVQSTKGGLSSSLTASMTQHSATSVVTRAQMRDNAKSFGKGERRPDLTKVDIRHVNVDLVRPSVQSHQTLADHRTRIRLLDQQEHSGLH